MKPLVLKLRSRAAHGPAAGDGTDDVSTPSAGTGDDTLGRGMDVALTLLAFLGIGWLIDRWLGVFPVFTIGLVVFSAIGTFVRMKYVYDARMELLEAERLGRRAPANDRGAA